jgi:subtilisin family serine protease
MTQLRAALIAHTESTQRSIRSFLDARNVQYKTHWITNRIFVRNAEEALVTELANTLGSDIKEIREEIVAQLNPIKPIRASKEAKAAKAPARGVWLVGADQLWAKGIDGQGLVVSNIDTGVRGSHEILKPNFRGDYGWFDPAYGTSEPEDDNGHGTHTMGTIAGQNGFGVAPGAKWMACVGCTAFGCAEEDLYSCAEFTACPHLSDGSNADCSKAPAVSSNSWGSTVGGDDWYDDAIEVMKTAGVIVVFSAGNSGSSCSTVGSPGDRDVIGVAALDMDKKIATFSSRGPAVDGSAKPDIAAPGVDVLSSWNTGDDQYDRLSGTSMACPHVSGAVALLIQNNPALAGNQTAVMQVLTKGALQEGLTGSGQNCDGIDDVTFPNRVFGYGMLHVPKSAETSV